MNRLIPAVFDDLGVGVVVHNVDSGDILEVNDRFEALYGYTESELREMSVDDYSVTAEGFTQTEAERRIRAAAGGEPQTFDWHVERADGHSLWVSVRLVRIELDGDPYVLAEVRDTTDHKEAERNRQELLDRMSDGFFAVDTEWQITHANERAATILTEAMNRDVGPDAVVGNHLWETVSEAVDTVLYDRYHEAMARQKRVCFEIYYEPLETWYDIRAYPSESGLSIYFYDITERHRQRELLEHRERVLREMYELISDHDRDFTDQVKALLALGRSELDIRHGTVSEINGEQYVFEIIETDDDTIQAGDVVPVSATNCERVASENRTLVLGDITRDAPDLTDRLGYTEMGISSYIGAPLVVDDTVRGTFCFYDTDPREEQFSEWEVTLVDLMSRWVSYELQRQATTERLQRQNEKLDRFASTVSHDLRNPLNILNGQLDLAAQTGGSDHFEACKRALDRMNTLIDELLSLAQAGETIDELHDVDLGSLVEACWATVRTEKATLRVETNRTIRADETRVKQLAENLFRNSVEHGSPDSWPPTDKNIKDDDKPLGVTVGDLTTGFYIEDDGVGISGDDYETIFESGYSTAEDGTGFGLAIIAEIADAHGWQVTATESDAGGMRFEFTGVTVVDEN